MIKGLPRKQKNSSGTARDHNVPFITICDSSRKDNKPQRATLVKDAVTDDFFIVPLMCSGSSCSSGKYL